MKTLDFNNEVFLGVSRVEITQVGHESYRGFPLSECEIVDPLYAKIQIWSDGSNEAIWIGLDECSLRNSIANELIMTLSKKTGVDKNFILLFCVHNHSGHNYTSLDLEKFKQTLYTGVESARKNLTKIKYLRQTIGINNKLINRRYHVNDTDGGICIMFNDDCVVDKNRGKLEISGQLNNARKSWGGESIALESSIHLNGDFDNRVHMWEFLSENKETVAVNIRVNAHPVVLSQSRVGKKISGDYVHRLEQMIEDEKGCLCSVMNGSFGDCRPLHQEYSLTAREQIATDYFDALMNGSPSEELIGSFSLKNFTAEKFSLRSQGALQNKDLVKSKLNDIEAKLAGFVGSKKALFDEREYLGALQLGFNGYINAILTDREIEEGAIHFDLPYWSVGSMKILALPGEPLIKLSREIESSTKGYLPIGLSNGYMSYMPHPDEVHLGGYEMNQNVLSSESLKKIAQNKV